MMYNYRCLMDYVVLVIVTEDKMQPADGFLLKKKVTFDEGRQE